MRVLFHAYNTCCQTESGGVQIRIRKIKKLLEERGVQVDFFNAFDTKLKDYDVLHVFSLKEESIGIVKMAKELGLKVIVSPIVNTTKWRADAIRNTLLFPHLLRHFGIEPIEYQRFEILNAADYIFVETKTEQGFIERYYKVDSKKIKIVPNGVDDLSYANNSIFEIIEDKKPYVLQIGRIDTNKNTLSTIRALKGADYNLVIIGGKYAGSNNSYYQKCLQEASGFENVHFIGWLEPESDLLTSAYQNAHVVVVPSYSETFGLVAIEAAMAGVHVCLSNTLAILDFGVFDTSLTFSPSSISELRAAVDKAISTPKNNDLKEKVKKVFSWKRIIDEHIDSYKC